MAKRSKSIFHPNPRNAEKKTNNKQNQRIIASTLIIRINLVEHAESNVRLHDERPLQPEIPNALALAEVQ